MTLLLRNTFLLPTLFVLALVSCDQKVDDVSENIAARSFDKQLSWDEISEIIPDQTTAEDSSELAERYINSWLKEQTLLHLAETSLTEDQKKFEKEIEDYRSSLLTYAFESNFVDQRLDTIVVKSEIETYYNENLENFELRDYIVKVRYCILNSEMKKVGKFRSLFFSQEEFDRVKIEQMCVDYGASYYLEDDKWLYFEELLEKIPLDVYNIDGFLKKRKNIEFENEGNLYFLHVEEYKLKDGVSPLELVTPQIKNVILNRRKIDLLNNLRDDAYNDALNKKNIEKYY